jgi:hypothetical protein
MLARAASRAFQAKAIHSTVSTQSASLSASARISNSSSSFRSQQCRRQLSTNNGSKGGESMTGAQKPPVTRYAEVVTGANKAVVSWKNFAVVAIASALSVSVVVVV